MSEGPRHATAELLKTLPTFAGLSEEQLARVVPLTEVRHLAAKEPLVVQGGPAEDIRIVVEGKFSLCLDIGGAEQCVLTLTRGEVIGWSALLGGPTWLASATALRDSTVVILRGADLLALCDADKAIGYHVMRNLFEAITSRLQDTRLQLLDMYGHA